MLCVIELRRALISYQDDHSQSCWVKPRHATSIAVPSALESSLFATTGAKGPEKRSAVPKTIVLRQALYTKGKFLNRSNLALSMSGYARASALGLFDGLDFAVPSM